MHEASLVEGLLKLILDYCTEYNKEHPERPVKKIKSIKCEAGLLANFEINTLKECFELLSEKTICEKADLEIKIKPLKCTCTECRHEFILTKIKFVCPQCQSIHINFGSGHGLTLLALEAETD